jgi:DEAD/DEAH box helicase domain-containing protein
MKKIDISSVLKELEQSRFFKPCITAKVQRESREGLYSDFPAEIEGTLQQALKDRGVLRLYSHQAEAFERLQGGRDIVVVTPTASGKTLCYNLSVLNGIIGDASQRALYLFPTKALAQDQRTELETLIERTGVDVRVYTYDGDTPADIRKKVRTQAQVVITNPDMLHTGILPHHTKWNRFFSQLSFVVIDEMHTYRGVSGSHMVNVLRRLKRVCAHYGSRPRVIFCSATISNPKELADRLIERDVFLIENSGAPQGKKIFYFINPPVVQKEIGLRASPKNMAQKIAERFLRKDISTIVFTTSRLNVEILTKYLKDLFRKLGQREEEKIRGYRGGYLPQTRREIERGLREGDIKGVVSTNALELGVDIGSLEACILCGYPGSIASTWQQAGRAGRRTGLSCAVLIARSNPMDQFIIRNPDYFFGRSPEHARLNPDNLTILVSHIKCAAFELPFRRGEIFGGEDLEEILDYLSEKKVLRKLSDRWFWAEDAYPADQISLRSVSAENFVVVDRSSGNRIIAEVDHDSAPLTLYPGAIYMVESQQYQTEELDYSNHKAYVSPVKAEYYTEAVLYTHLKILDTFQTDPEEARTGCPVFREGEVHVLNHVSGFKKLKFYSSENLGFGEVTLPDQEMHTSAFWITMDLENAQEMSLSVQELLEALEGTGYAMLHMASFLLMCETRDLGRVIGDPHEQLFFHGKKDVETIESCLQEDQKPLFRPTLFLYDAYPGGVGLSSALFSRRKELLRSTRSLIESCSCMKGCPSCVGPLPGLGEKTKENTSKVLEWMILGID